MLKPMDDRVVIRRAKGDDTTKGGIVLPDNAKEKPCRGEVLAVGPGKLLDNGTRAEMQVNVGDTVIFTDWTGNEVEHEGEDVIIIAEEHVLAIAA